MSLRNALFVAEEDSLRVVWLAQTWEKEDYGFEPREAVVLRGYLGKYDLIRII